jgi:N-acetylmuramoyl-L-alanine amidase
MLPNKIASIFRLSLAALFMFVLLLSLNPASSFAAGETAVVNADTLNVRGGPGTSYDVIQQNVNGDRLPVLDKSGDWVKVKLASGASGWVAGWLVAVEQPSPAPASFLPSAGQSSGGTAVVSGSSVNVRGGPGTGYDVMAQANQGDRLTVLDKSGDWVKIKLSSGSAGWIAGWLVSIEQPAPAKPAGDKPAPAVPATGSRAATVTGTVINVRSGPGTGSGILTQAYQGATLPVVDQSGDWYRVTLAGGNSGWVAGWLVSVKTMSPLPTSPISPSPSPALPDRGSVDRPEDNANKPVDNGNKPEDSTNKPVDSTSGKLLSLQVDNSSGKTSAVVKANAPFNYASFTLENPSRLVVDCKGVGIGSVPSSTQVNSKTINQVRAGYYQKDPDITRLVFDLPPGVQYVAALSKDKKTLTVDTYIPDLSGAYKGKTVVIDPGHGGSDPGAVGQNGLKEKDVTLDIAKRVQRLLEAKGAMVIMARPGDTEVDLYERTNRANRAGADIFVSIHINAHNDRVYGGTSTYLYQNDMKDQPASRVQNSRRLANYVQNELLKSLGLRDVGVKEAHFAVLRTSSMPSILAEIAFISNTREESLMRTDDFKNKAAEAIAKGIGLYFSDSRVAGQDSMS